MTANWQGCHEILKDFAGVEVGDQIITLLVMHTEVELIIMNL